MCHVESKYGRRKCRVCPCPCAPLHLYAPRGCTVEGDGESLDRVYSVGFVFRLASFSSIAERMNLKYVRSIMRRLVPVCEATVSGSTP
jgi:hypothetical protein